MWLYNFIIFTPENIFMDMVDSNLHSRFGISNLKPFQE
jgi:hypothetical protein